LRHGRFQEVTLNPCRRLSSRWTSYTNLLCHPEPEYKWLPIVSMDIPTTASASA
jgi:hypothetical protein